MFNITDYLQLLLVSVMLCLVSIRGEEESLLDYATASEVGIMNGYHGYDIISKGFRMQSHNNSNYEYKIKLAKSEYIQGVYILTYCSSRY